MISSERDSPLSPELVSSMSLEDALRALGLEHAAANLEYEKAALLRDQIAELKSGTGISKIEPKKKPVTYGKPKRGGSIGAKGDAPRINQVPGQSQNDPGEQPT